MGPRRGRFEMALPKMSNLVVNSNIASYNNWAKRELIASLSKKVRTVLAS